MSTTRTTRRAARGGLLLAALAGFTACAGDDGGTGPAAAVRDSAGVRMVENSGAGLWEEGAGWTLEQVLSIGEAAGDADYQFGQIAGVDVLSDGRIAVLDRLAQRVQLYAADGTYARTIGKAGNGPGEFSVGVAALFVGRGDTIVVPDGGNQRVTLLPPEGDASSFPLQMELGVPMGFDMAVDGNLVSQRRALNLPDGATVASGKDVIIAQTYDGTIVDTLLTPERGATFEMTETGPRITLFAPEPMWAMLDDGRIAFATNDAYRIEIYSTAGNLEQVVSLPREPEPVTEADERVVRDMVRKSMEENGVPAPMVDQMLGQMALAENWPVFTQLRGGPEGTLWVQRIRTVGELSEDELENWDPQLDQGAPEWDVFEADGRYGGVVELPARFTPFSIRDGRIYGVFRDDFDIQTVRIYELSERPRFSDA